MNACAWAAMGMSVSDASRPCGLKDLPPNLIESEPHVTVGHAFIRQCFLPGFISQHKVFNCSFIHIQLSIRGKVDLSLWICSEGQGSGSGKDFRRATVARVCLAGKTLPAVRMERIKGEKYGLLHESVPFFVWFSSSASCFSVLRVQYLFQRILEARGDRRTAESFERDAPAIMEGLRLLFLCVFQGSAGASASREGEGSAAVCFLGTTGEPAGELSAGSDAWSVGCFWTTEFVTCQ